MSLVFPLPIVPYISSPVTRVLLAFLARHFAKNKVPEKEAVPEPQRKVAGPKIKFTIRFFHIDHNAPSLHSKSLHNCCFPFLPGITVVPREIKDNCYATFGGGGGVGGGAWG